MMCNFRRVTLVFLLVTAHSPLAFSQCLLTGKVSNSGAPVAGAELTIRNNNTQLSVVQSRTDGIYTAQYAPPPAHSPAVQIEIKARGYAKDSRNIFVSRDKDCPATDSVNFALSPDASVEGAAGAPSFTIYISPFTLYGSEGNDYAQKFNQDLPNFIYHKIMSYKGDLAARDKIKDMTINPLEQTLTPAQGAQIRNIGHQLGALAIVVGEMEAMGTQNLGLEMVSSVKSIPIFEDIELNSVLINDEITTSSLRPSKVGKNLSNHWGKHAVLSYVLQNLSRHQGVWLADDLEDLEQILISVKSTIRDEKDPYKAMVDQLLEAVRAKKS